jgi:hypothetical protein
MPEMRISPIKARAIWFVDLQDLNPKGKSLYPEVVDALESKYEFDKVPESASDAKNGGLEFIQGGFEVSEDNWIDVNLTVYNDGLVVDTRSSTRHCDAFLEDLLKFAVSLGMQYSPELVRRKTYISEVAIHTNRRLEVVNPKFREFSDRLASLLPGGGFQFEVTSLTFATDPQFQVRPSPFQFERKIGVPFADNRYYSQAPIHTDDHETLLREFESLFM